MKNRKSLAMAGSVCLLLTSVTGWTQQPGILTIETLHMDGKQGKIVVNLFRESDELPEKPFVTLNGEIFEGTGKIIVNDLPYGEYAAIAFHDENGNGKLDHRLGFPSEPMGFSNGWRLSLFSGMPTFTKLKFLFLSSATNIRIKISD